MVTDLKRERTYHLYENIRSGQKRLEETVALTPVCGQRRKSIVLLENIIQSSYSFKNNYQIEFLALIAGLHYLVRIIKNAGNDRLRYDLIPFLPEGN